MTLGMLIAYDDDYNVVATLDYGTTRNDQGEVTGLVDFAAHEAAGGEHTDIWTVAFRYSEPDGTVLDTAAKGSKVWPEYLGGQAHQFRVELVGPPGQKRINALIHKTSGHRRERAAIEAAIEAVLPHRTTGAKDIRGIVGGPHRPLPLDEHGKTAPRATGARPNVPLIGIGTPQP